MCRCEHSFRVLSSLLKPVPTQLTQLKQRLYETTPCFLGVSLTDYHAAITAQVISALYDPSLSTVTLKHHGGEVKNALGVDFNYFPCTHVGLSSPEDVQTFG